MTEDIDYDTESRELTKKGLADVVAGKAFALRNGAIDRSQFRKELAAVLSNEPEVLTTGEPLDAAGGFSFGENYGKRTGTLLHVPYEVGTYRVSYNGDSIECFAESKTHAREWVMTHYFEKPDALNEAEVEVVTTPESD